MAISVITYPSSAQTVSQPVIFEILLDETGVSYFYRFVSSKVVVSTGIGNANDVTILGLPSFVGGTFTSGSTGLNDGTLYYKRLETVYEIDHPVFGIVPITVKSPDGSGTFFDGEWWDTFLTSENVPNKPVNPSPADAAISITLYPTLSWDAG